MLTKYERGFIIQVIDNNGYCPLVNCIRGTIAIRDVTDIPVEEVITCPIGCHRFEWSMGIAYERACKLLIQDDIDREIESGTTVQA